MHLRLVTEVSVTLLIVYNVLIFRNSKYDRIYSMAIVNDIKHLITTIKIKIRILIDPPAKWEKYYQKTKDWTLVPEPFLYNLKLPGSITTFLDIGCASGRNFIPFDGKLELWGIDIVPEKRIKWVSSFKKLKYEKMTIEQFTRILEHGKKRLDDVLLFTFGTMMYVNEKEQRRFFRACRLAGCKNFIFSEYPANSPISPRLNFKLPPEWFTVIKHDRGITIFSSLSQRLN